MAPNTDSLIRFLLPDVKCRGALIRGTHIFEAAKAAHGLSDTPAQMFGQTLLASILLLSSSKGGIRQVLQLDAHPQQSQAPIQRILAEARSGAVRGYLNWQEESIGHRNEHEQGISAWMGHPLHISTVRDLGFGHPYVSTIEHDSEFLADHIVQYLNQSVQIHADIVLVGETALLIEAMPGCEDESWFKAVETLATISSDTFIHQQPEEIIAAFDTLHATIVGRDAYAYQCRCSVEKMADLLHNMNPEDLKSLADEEGNVTLSCQYCSSHYTLTI